MLRYVVMLLGVTCLLSISEASEFNVEARLSTDPQYSFVSERFSEAGRQLFESIRAESTMKERTLTIEEIRQILLTNKNRIESGDVESLMHLLSMMQRPQISGKDLSLLFRSCRQSVDKSYIEYQVQQLVELVPYKSSGETRKGVTADCVLAFNNSKKFFSQRVHEDGQFLKLLVNSYDGQVTRSLIQVEGSMQNLTISEGNPGLRFFPVGSPIRNAKLVNLSDDLLSDPSGSYDDFADFVMKSMVFEQTVEIEGLTCLAVGNLQNMCYCSIVNGYAVVRAELGMFQFDSEKGTFHIPTSNHIVNNSSFVKLADNVWLPQKTTILGRIDDNIVEHVETTVSVLRSAPPDDEMFVLKVEKYGHVSDQIQKASYIVNNSKRSDKATPAAQASGGWTRNSALLTVNGIAVMLLLVWFSKRFIMKQSS